MSDEKKMTREEAFECVEKLIAKMNGKFVPGFTFKDDDKEECIYLGIGEYERTDYINLCGKDYMGGEHETREVVIVFVPVSHVYTYLRKGRSFGITSFETTLIYDGEEAFKKLFDCVFETSCEK